MSISTRASLSVLPAILALGFLPSCTGNECADGTIEQDGVCVPATDDPSAANCGEGTVLGDSGQCEPALPPTVCGDNTEENPTLDPGVITCVGTGGSNNCEDALNCPGAAANKVTVCGRLYDIETDTQIRAAVPNVKVCGSGTEATDGPCQLEISFYDALDFAGNPSGAAKLPVQNFRQDDCGRFVAENINRPSLGFLGIGIDDAMGEPDEHRLTGVAFPVASGQVFSNEETYVVLGSTDDDWSADVAFGANTFVDRGVFMSIFYHGDDPAPGVTVTSNGSVRAGDDYYFTNTDPLLRNEVIANGPTQANGAALLLGSSLVEHSGQGGEPGSCVWPSDLAASIPNVLFFNPRVAETAGGTECP